MLIIKLKQDKDEFKLEAVKKHCKPVKMFKIDVY